MNVKNKVKKIFAVAASAALVGTTLVGAMATDLSDYPAQFIEDGIFNGAIVVGENAAARDIMGSIDIAASLQAEAVTPAASAGTETISVSGESVEFEDLNFGMALEDVEQSLDVDDMPSILADGEVTDVDDSDVDYDQELTIGDAGYIEFNSFDEDYYHDSALGVDKVPVFYSYLNDTVYNLTVDFDSDINVIPASTESFSESITIAGADFTFKPDIATGESDELILYKSDESVVVGVGEVVSVDGYDIEVIGANTDSSEATIKVDGVAHQVTVGDTVGDFYINEIFMQTIPVEAAQVEIFVGSDEVKISVDSFDEIKVNGEDLDGYYARAYTTGGDLGTLDKIEFYLKPNELDLDSSNYDGDEAEYMELGEELVDPLFETFKLSFEGMLPNAKESSDYIKVYRSGSDMNFKFVNDNGEEAEWTVWEDDGSNVIQNPNFMTGETTLDKNDIFILEHPNDMLSTVFEVKSVDDGNISADFEVEIENIATGVSKSYQDGDVIGDFNVVVSANTGDATGNSFTIDSASKEYVYTMNGVKATFDYTNATNATSYDAYAVIEITETEMDELDSLINSAVGDNITLNTTLSSGDLQFSKDYDAATLRVDENDNGYAVTTIGSYIMTDEEDHEVFEMWIPSEEVDYKVFLSEMDSSSVVSSSADSYVVNPVNLGLAITDADAVLGSMPYIVVGGPMANSVAAELMGNPTEAQIMETFSEGKAMIKWYDEHSAMLVAGYSDVDTLGAAYVVADHSNYDLSGDEVEVVVTSLDDISVVSE